MIRGPIQSGVRSGASSGTGRRKSGAGYDADAVTYFGLDAGATRKADINGYTVGMNEIFGRGNWAVWMTEEGLISDGATVQKLGSTAWGGPGAFGGAPLPTVGAGTPMLTANGQFIDLDSWGAPFGAGAYIFTLAAPNSVTAGARSRGLSIEDDDGIPLGGLWIAYDTLMYADMLGSGSGRVSGPSGATAGVASLFAGTSEGRCWRNTTLIASGGGTDSLGNVFDQVQIGRSGGSVQSNMTHHISGAVALPDISDAEHNSHYALLKAKLFPWLPVLALATLVNGYVWADGNGVEFVLDKDLATVSKAGLVVTADGEQIPIDRVTLARNPEGGKKWEARFKNHWITEGQTVVISYSGDQFNHHEGFTVVPNYQTSQTTTRAVAAFADRTWMSIHWNMATYTIANGTSGQLAPGDSNVDLLNPTGLTSPASIDNWVQAAQSIDATGLMLTTKHVDGYCLWESTVTENRCVTASEPWWSTNGFDIVDAFCTRTRAAGLKVGFYFSVLDRRFRLDHPEWSFEDYETIPEAAAAYTAYVQGQLTELLDGRYGTINMILLDAWYIPGNPEYATYTSVDKDSTIALIRSLQPDIVILVNDYTQGQGGVSEIAIYESGTEQPIPRDVNRNVACYWSTPDESNNTWFYDATRRANYVSGADHAEQVALTRARQGFLIFNISPPTTGVFNAADLAYCAEVGAAIA